jgi:hypothetical protein
LHHRHAAQDAGVDKDLPMIMKSASRFRTAAFVALAGLGLSACASHKYVDENIATVNTRLQAVEA